MNNLEIKSQSFWFDFKEGRLLRLVGIFLPVALLMYLDSLYEFTQKQHFLFLGLYLLLHGIWTYFSKTFPIFVNRTVSGGTTTVILREKYAMYIAILLIVAGIVLVGFSF